VNNKQLSEDGKKKLAVVWNHIQYFIIDECSMLPKDFFAQLSRHITIAKVESNSSVSDLPFGGVNILLCGDFHQFPPVATSPNNALYHLTRIGLDPPNILLGCKIYEKFQTVVILKHQVCTSNPVWQKFLNTLHQGHIQEEDIAMLKGLILTNLQCPPTNLNSELWKNCSLITPQHTVQIRWNNAAVLEVACFGCTSFVLLFLLVLSVSLSHCLPVTMCDFSSCFFVVTFLYPSCC
jgi:hypothetical protein